MSTPVFPLGLPAIQFPAAGPTTFVVGYLESQMDVGDAKRRPLFTGPAQSVATCSIICTGDQRDTFKTFAQTTLAQCSLAFTYTDPNTGDSQNYYLNGDYTIQKIMIGSSEYYQICFVLQSVASV